MRSTSRPWEWEQLDPQEHRGWIAAMLYGLYDIEGDDRLVDSLADANEPALPDAEPAVRSPFWVR